MFVSQELRLVLVGKTGVGKSATGNTIAGEKNKFESKASDGSVTTKCDSAMFYLMGRSVQVVDAPGFLDTERTDGDLKKEMIRCVALSSPGIHAILFHVRIGRFKQDDVRAIELFTELFGQDAWKHVIIVFTGKDDIDADGTSEEEYIKDLQKPLKDLLSKAGDRFIFVNNRGQKDEKEDFRVELINMVEDIRKMNNNSCYTNPLYEEAEKNLSEIEAGEYKKIAMKYRLEDKNKKKAKTEEEVDLRNQREAREVLRHVMAEDTSGMKVKDMIGKEACTMIGEYFGKAFAHANSTALEVMMDVLAVQDSG